MEMAGWSRLPPAIKVRRIVAEALPGSAAVTLLGGGNATVFPLTLIGYRISVTRLSAAPPTLSPSCDERGILKSCIRNGRWLRA
jgi:hypothetical protein